MGLDMYINRTVRKYRQKDGTYKDGFDNYTDDEFGCNNGVNITDNICYWRKANSIHNWFVKNIQNGVDECQSSYLDIEKLHRLYNECLGILKVIDGKRFYLDQKTIDWQNDIKKDNPKYKKDKTEIIFSYQKFKNMYKCGIWKYKIDIDEKTAEFIYKHLPPTSEFFFGSTEIDGGYFYDMIKTILMLDRLFKENKKALKNEIYYDYEYVAS